MKRFPYLLALFLTACSSSSPRYLFTPSPAEIMIQPKAGVLVARALISVLQGNQDEGRSTMHVRLRVENRDDTPVRIAPESLQLVASDLAEFGPAGIEPALSEIPPGGVHTYDLRFPFPPGRSMSAPDLDGLNLIWRLDYSDGAAEVSTTFQRRVAAEYAPAPNVTWSIGVGYYR